MQNLLATWNKLTSGSINRKIFSAVVTVGLFTVFVKTTSTVKELVVAWRFGTGDDQDAFLIALMLPELSINVLVVSFTAALIPTYVRVREQEGKKAAQQLFSGAVVLGLGVLGIATVLLVATAPLYLPWIALGFNSQKLDLTFRLLCTIAPFVLLSGTIQTWSAILNAGERFALAAVSPLVTPTTCILLLVSFKSWGIFALAAGLICGAIIEIVILGIALRRQGISLLPRWYKFDDRLRQVVSQYIPMVAGALLLCSASSVDQAMAAMLAPGSVAALNYGNRIIASVMSLIATALSAAVITYASQMVACQDWVGISHTLKYYIRLIFFTTVPLAGLLIIFSEPLVQILFQRGAFTDENTHLVAQIQNLAALQIPFYLGNLLLFRFISSMQLNHVIMWCCGLSLLVNISANYIFAIWLGVKGIALSTSCVYVFSFLFLLFFAAKHLQNQRVHKNNSSSK
ncbi:MAG: lipid II flippase MurJ [Chroococcidiopsis sp. SAG 2025]|uniref:murein biosynthesis integral membrane protein MurJ n=1 Tax=Chroococcidiopsis sp. SAG 2025 TaxID=171389 RepID=UPI0029373A81|nr:lipid II flippase MurJ [Chroococcidiopsis sp. SAG 2025]MDV2991084.1 lipid II flippase MurJ [Chroococcidiopsis sp. SAG 2025]